MTKRKALDILPLLILIGALAYTFLYFDFRVDLFPFEFLFGLALTALSGLAYILWRKAFKTLLGLTLIFGTFNLIKFLPAFITFGGGLNLTVFDRGFTVSIQLFSLVVLLIFAYINRQRLRQIMDGVIKDKPLTETEKIEEREKK